jgi:hypothetical protein
MTQTERPWSFSVRIENVPDEGAHFDISADDNVRTAIAALTGLKALMRLKASFDVTRRGPGLHVTGEISATVGQTCVVTLEPVENEVREVADLVFAPAAGGPESGDVPPGSRNRRSKAPPPQEPRTLQEPSTLDLGGSEPPEDMVNGVVDLGALAVEYLLLGIDPYPRKPNAVFAAPRIGEASAHPFAALAKLKQKPDPDSA